MPDTPDFDDARRALNEVPAPDLWDEAQRRAADGTVVPLAVDRDRRRPGRWLAVAAAAALAVGTVAVLADDDDQSIDTSPRATPPSTTEDGMVDDGVTVTGPDGCSIGLGGDTVVVEPGPADPERFGAGGQPADQLVFHLPLGTTQTAEVHVPGVVVTDLVGERVEDVELQRGTAQVWFSTEFVQVRWFTGSQEPCSSFTVTVSGGTEDANRHAAVDLAERILLPEDLAAPSGDDPSEPGDGIVGRDVPYAIWPMTAPEPILGYLPEFTGTPEEMALSFAREVLEWSDAVVTDREPSEDGSNGAVYLVASAATGDEVEIWTRPGVPQDLNVVYKVDTPGRWDDPDAGASVSSVGSTGRADVTPVPEGTASSTVRFIYGEYVYEGPMGEDIELLDRRSWNGEDVAGAVLILFRDASGRVIGAWGTPLHAGDFAAG